MNEQSESALKKEQNIVQPNKTPNESGSFSIESHVRIFDPNTKEVYVEKRA
jgi:hypothetical protein